MFPCYSLPNIKVIWIYYLLINSYELIIGYLYFSNNLKRHKRPRIGLYNKL